MPYRSVPKPGGDPFEIGERRWCALADVRPDLSPAVVLQRQLLTIVAELARVLENGSPPLPLPRPAHLAAKLTRGVPALAAEPIRLPVRILRPRLLQLCATLADGGAGEAATHIETTLSKGDIDAGSLMAACLARDETAIRCGAVHHGLAPDLVWLVAELAVGPFVHMLQHRLLGADDAVLTPALDAWDRGYCPACGSWPAVAEVVDGHRTLRCSFCASGWAPAQYACIYCGEADQAFATAAPNPERKDRRIEMCRSCGGYLKSLDLPELSPYPLVSISDLETTDLDVAAMEQGYARPMLKDFGELGRAGEAGRAG